MCEDCNKLREQGYDFPRKVPEHASVFLDGDLVVFDTLCRGLMTFVDGCQILTVVDSTVRPGLQDEVLYINSRPKKSGE